MPRTQPIKHGQSHTIEWDLQALSGLPTMGVRDQEIAAPILCEGFEIFQIADKHVVSCDTSEDRRRGGGHRDGKLSAHLMQHAADIKQQVGFRADRQLAATYARLCRKSHPFLRSASDLFAFLPQPGSLKTPWMAILTKWRAIEERLDFLDKIIRQNKEIETVSDSS